MRLRPRLTTPARALLLLAFASCAPAFAQPVEEAARQPRRQQAEAPLPADAAAELEKFRRSPKLITSDITRPIRNHEGDADALHSIGMHYLREGVPKRYVHEALSAAVALRPTVFPSAHAVLALMLLDANNLDNAALHARVAFDAGTRPAEMAHVLGEVAYRRGDYRQALAHAVEALKADDAHPPSLLLRSQSLVRAGRITDAIADLDRFLALKPDDPDAEAWREHLATLRMLPTMPASYAAPHFDADAEGPAPRSAADRTTTTATKTATPSNTKAVINAKPEPGFTDEAKEDSIQGVVRLRVTLTHDGRVTNPLVLRSLTHGLTTQALRAALSVKFKPAQKDGRPVAQAVILEYNFQVF